MSLNHVSDPNDPWITPVYFADMNMVTAPVVNYVATCLDSTGHIGWTSVGTAATGQNIFCRAIYTNNGSAAAPSHSFQAATGSGLYQSAGVNIATAGVQRLTIDNSGNNIIRNSTIGVRSDLGSDNSGVTHYRLATTAGDTRASIGLLGTDTTDAGSNVRLWVYNDAGSVVFTPLGVQRDTGTVLIGGPPLFQSLTDNTNGNLTSASFAASFQNGVNVTFSAPGTGYYQRIGNIISVYGSVTVNLADPGPTWTGAMNLPFGTATNAVGSCSMQITGGLNTDPLVACGILGINTNRAVFNFTSETTLATGSTYLATFSFSYIIS